MRSSLKQLLTFFIGWPLSIAAIYFIVRTFLPRLSQVKHLLTDINLYLFLIGIGCFLIYYFLRSVLWQKIIRSLGYEIPFQKSCFSWATSEFKRYIPGNIWSFLGRSILFTNYGMTKTHLAKAVIFEMQIVLLGAVVTSLLSLPFLTKIISIPQIKFLFSPLILLITFVIVLIYLHQKRISALIPVRYIAFLNHFLPFYNYFKIFNLLSLSTLAFAFFGFGYYFCISSIIPLDPAHFLILSGFFVFSLLVGLFSVITPTGLGVREGVVTLGLDFVLMSGLAGFASIFGRISLIISEIIFLTLSRLYFGFNSRKAKIFESFISEKKHKFLLIIFIIFFNLYFIPVSFLRYDNFYTGRFDLGNMSQTVWNTKYGRFFEFTNPDGIENVSRLAFHADFILILITPFYFLWENPKMLLIIQSVVVSLGALFIYKLTLVVLKKSNNVKTKGTDLIALTLSFSYLMNPSLQWSILYDFHAVTLASTFLIASFYFIYNKRYFLFLIFALLAGLTKEQVWIPVALMGFYFVFTVIINHRINTDRNKILFGLLVFVLSLFNFYYLIWHAIPNAAGTDEHFALSYFKQDSEGPADLILNALSYPSDTLNKLLENNRITYLRSIFEPVGYLPLIAPLYLLFPSADFLLNLLSDKPELQQIYYQYTSVITPFIYISAIIAISALCNLLKQKYSFYIALYIVIAVVLGGYKFGPLPWTKKANLAMLQKPERNRIFIDSQLAAIPLKFSVSSTNNLGAHLSHRKNLYTIPNATNSADYIVFLIRNNSPKLEYDLVNIIHSNKAYSKITEKDGFIVFKKKLAGN